MRIQLCANGDVDDLAVELADVAIERTGDARYAMRVRCARELEIRIWTTRKQRVLVRPLDETTPEWIAIEIVPDGVLESLRASRCSVHLEQMDRGSYFLGLARGEQDYWGVGLRAHGYLRARIDAPISSA